MNTFRLRFPRVATALLAGVVLAWCAAQTFPSAAPAAPDSAAAKSSLLLAGVTVVPLISPLITLLLEAARE